MAGVFVKGHQRGKSIVKAYTRNRLFKKGVSKTGRVIKIMNRLSGDLGAANASGQAKRARTLRKRMGTVVTYARTHGL